MVFVFSKFKKRWVPYSGTLDEALESMLPEHVFEGEECPSPWFRSAGMKWLQDKADRASNYQEGKYDDGEPTPGFPRDRD